MWHQINKLLALLMPTCSMGSVPHSLATFSLAWSNHESTVAPKCLCVIVFCGTKFHFMFRVYFQTVQLRQLKKQKIQAFVIMVYFAPFEPWTVNKKSYLPPTISSHPPILFPNWRLQIECVLLKLCLVYSCMCTQNGPAEQDCAIHWERKQPVNDQFQLLRLSRIPPVLL